MKRTFQLVLALVSVALAGCATNYQGDKVQENVWKNFAAIDLTAKKQDARVYVIVARGAGKSREEDIIAAWNEFAEKIAAGRPFTKECHVEDYEYMDTVGYARFQAKRVVGKIAFTDGR